jgi:hypothetical protein
MRAMKMAVPITPVSALRRLPWQAQGGFQVVTDGTCLYMREGVGSMIAGVVFAVVLGLSAGGYGGWLLLTQTTVIAWAFAGLMFVVAAVFAFVLCYSARRGRSMIVYDRGQPGAPGEIRYDGKHLPAERVRSLSTRPFGSSPMPRHVVVAELHDGTFEVLGPSGVSTWPAHYGQQAATWMGLPFRHLTE